MAGGDAAGTLYAYQVPAGGYAPNGNILSQTDSVMGTWNLESNRTFPKRGGTRACPFSEQVTKVPNCAVLIPVCNERWNGAVLMLVNLPFG